MHGLEQRSVYILRSDTDPSRHYVGLTNDLRGRIDWHHCAKTGYTVEHRPWSIVVSTEFPTEREAVRFEKYLKSGSGRAFAKRHFAPPEQARCSPYGIEPFRLRGARAATHHGLLSPP